MTKGKWIARRNLIWSIVAEHLGFSIWLIWSIVATKLAQAGFHYATEQLFQLVALPGLIGSLMHLMVAVAGAFLFMNNITSARSTFKDQLAIVTRKHTWVMSYIYIGTFGSFIGYSAAFPLLIKTQPNHAG